MKKVIVSLVLSSILVALSLRGISFHHVAESLRQIQPRYVFLSLIMMLLAQVLRSIRWGTILKPVAHVDPLRLFAINNAGYLAIVAIPARLGELGRPLLISRKQAVPLSASVATVCVERIMDVLVLSAMTGCVCLMMPLSSWLIRSVCLILIAALAAVFCFIPRLVRKNTLESVANRLPAFLQQRYSETITRLIGTFCDGLAVFADGKQLIRLVFLSAAVWLSQIFALYTLFCAFGYSFSPSSVSVLLFTLIAGILIPAAPGFAGMLLGACLSAFPFFGLGQTDALSFALAYHALFVGLVLVLGVPFIPGMIGETWNDAVREVLHLLSMVFSNTVGLVEIRRGKLYQRKDVLLDIHNILKSGDILLDKTPFRLTDKLIPGYWGHAALWIGTKSELKNMGIWNHPIVTRYHKEIRKGKTVVEALRSGVEMNTLEHFLNIDSIGILRKPDQNGEDRAGTIIRALHQVGKPYDFNFEVETRNRVYCSKLVYLSYASMQWPTRKSLGRATITPDDVAIPAALHGKLELVSFYHDGRRIDERPAVKMAQLMRLEVN